MGNVDRAQQRISAAVVFQWILFDNPGSADVTFAGRAPEISTVGGVPRPVENPKGDSVGCRLTRAIRLSPLSDLAQPSVRNLRLTLLEFASYWVLARLVFSSTTMRSAETGLSMTPDSSEKGIELQPSSEGLSPDTSTDTDTEHDSG